MLFEFFSIMTVKLPEDARLALCINRIVRLIKERYNYDLSPDEQTYLCIHIKKNTNTNN